MKVWTKSIVCLLLTAVYENLGKCVSACNLSFSRYIVLIYAIKNILGDLLNVPCSSDSKVVRFIEQELAEMLLDKMRIKKASKTVLPATKQHSFYKGYALFVRKALRKPLFQRFLRWLLARENIDKGRIEEVQIRVFPLQNKKGNSIAGKWNRRGNISIFPKNYKFYKRLAAKYGRGVAHSYVTSRARATLIHEILHSKYTDDEKKVRKLTKKYFTLYSEDPRTEHLKSIVPQILFKQ